MPFTDAMIISSEETDSFLVFSAARARRFSFFFFFTFFFFRFSFLFTSGSATMVTFLGVFRGDVRVGVFDGVF